MRDKLLEEQRLKEERRKEAEEKEKVLFMLNSLFSAVAPHIS